MSMRKQKRALVRKQDRARIVTVWNWWNGAFAGRYRVWTWTKARYRPHDKRLDAIWNARHESLTAAA